MSALTLETLISKKYIHMNHSDFIESEDDITFDLLRKLSDAKKSGNLAAESYIFLECRNSIDHMSNIVRRIFVDDEPMNVNNIIHQELELIFDEMSTSNGDTKGLETRFDEKLLFAKEELKQIIFRRIGQVHSHINHTESTIATLHEMRENDELIQRIKYIENATRGNIERLKKLEDICLHQIQMTQSSIENQDDLITHSVGNIVGNLVPRIVEDSIAENVTKTNEIREIVLAVAKDLRIADEVTRINDLHSMIKSMKSEIHSLKKTIGVPVKKDQPPSLEIPRQAKPKQVSRTQFFVRTEENDEEDGSFF